MSDPATKLIVPDPQGNFVKITEIFRFHPPYEGEIPKEINGITLPADYVEFLRRHNGYYDMLGKYDGIIFPFDQRRKLLERFCWITLDDWDDVSPYDSRVLRSEEERKEILKRFCSRNVIIGADLSGYGDVVGIDMYGTYFIVDIYDVSGGTMEDICRVKHFSEVLEHLARCAFY